MARRRKEIVWPHLNNVGKDLNKLWYVEYSLRNPITGEMERFRHHEGFKELKTIKERMVYAQKLIEDYTKRIKFVEIGFSEVVEYNDLLSYNGYVSFSRRKKTTPGSAQMYLSEFLEYKESEITKKTLQTYRSKLRIFDSFLENKKLHNKPVSSISNDMIIEFLKAIYKEKELSHKSVEKYQQILYTFFQYLIKIKQLKIENPVLNIPRIGIIKDESSEAIPLDIRMKLKTIIEQEDPQLWMAICFIYYTAIRPGTELRLMKLNQINYSSRTIVVKNFLAKNGRTETVDIPDPLYDLIVNVWKLQKYDQNLYIFGKNNLPGNIPLGKNAMRIRFNVFRDQLNLSKYIHYYSWKHSGAQELADAGANPYELQRHLRHRDLATTESYLRKRIGQKSSMIKHNFPSIG